MDKPEFPRPVAIHIIRFLVIVLAVAAVLGLTSPSMLGFNWLEAWLR